MHLFSNIKYQLSGQEIESLYYPGQGTTMSGLLKYPDDFSKSQGVNQLWFKDTGATAIIADNSCLQSDNLIWLNRQIQKEHLSFVFHLSILSGSARITTKLCTV